MKIELAPNEQPLFNEIHSTSEKLKKAFSSFRSSDEEVRGWINEAGQKSHQLHMLLKGRGLEPKHHKYMVDNRGYQPDDPNFYLHFHPIEDLLKFIQDTSANDDPIDVTLGHEFTFRVYSSRWGHDDLYRIKRTIDGWDIFNLSGGACDKGGRPHLMENLRHDSIEYPARLESRMEWLWDCAALKGLTAPMLQDALQELADWISQIEKAAPNSDVWEGY